MSRFDVAACSGMPAAFALMLSCWVTTPANAQEACTPPIARIVSIQGSVEIQRAGQSTWVRTTRLDTPLCAGDRVQTGMRSRAALVISPETLLRLDQNSALSVRVTKDETVVEFFQNSAAPREALGNACGAGYFISRFPRNFKVRTPFLNAAVEGTEFLVALSCETTTLSVIEGRVAAQVPAADQRLTVHSGQTASAGPGVIPAVQALVKPIDAAQWTLYYPLLGAASTTATADQACDQTDAASLAACLTARAGQRLRVGQAGEAQIDLQQALAAQRDSAGALALLAIVDVVKNDRVHAAELATRAVEVAPGSAAAWLALSYAQQANFQLDQALKSTQRAMSIEPGNAALRARVAELFLSVGRVDDAQTQAREAVRMDPTDARAHIALGFVDLAQIRNDKAREDFRRAIALDPSNPMPRLGLGLALIREGRLVEGREQIEIAVALDPASSILRSYVGKAYYEENTKARDKLATTQYGLAEALDPKDPTPWFYGAFLKQTQNRPVEALQDLDQSIKRNDNRAVYRSRLLLDDDLAARSASQARIYSDLNFQQLAQVEGWRSLSADPTNYSAHRFLADAYLTEPRAEVSRLSELLQSQLWQPLNLQPLQPQLTQPGLFIPQGTGPSRLSYNEYNSLFTRDGLQLYADGIGGDDGTWGDDLVLSGLAGRASFSLGQFHFQTDGFRANADQTRDLANAFVQITPSADTSVQAEYGTQHNAFGDLQLRFDPANFDPSARTDENISTGRIGFRHDFAPSVRVIGSFLAQQASEDRSNLQSVTLVIPAPPLPPPFPPLPPIVVTQDIATTSSLEQRSYLGELQMVNAWDRVRFVSGLGYFDGSNRGNINVTINSIALPTIPVDEHSRQGNLYSYGTFVWPSNVSWTLGLSANDYDSVAAGGTQFNPKFGVVWTPTPSTILRAAAFRVLKRDLVADQTIEPTQVVGFNQFFDDPASTLSTRYGIAVDQRFGARLFGGLEASRRFLDIPFIVSQTGEQREAQSNETFNRAYLYWTPTRQLALSAQYQFDLRSTDLVTNGFGYRRLSTQRAPIGASWFLPNGLTLSAVASWVSQDGQFSNTLNDQSVESTGTATFWVADAQVSYRFPNRYGALSVGVRNLFDQQVHYFDPDPSNPWLYPERFAYVRLELQF